MAIDSSDKLNTFSDSASSKDTAGKDVVVYELNKDRQVCDAEKGPVEEDTDRAKGEEGPDEDDGLPIDRGWAWVILAGTLFYLFLMGGKRKNYGIFFVAFQDRFHSSAATTSLLTTIQSMVISVTSLFVMTIGMHHMSNRTSVMIGAVLLTIGDVTNAFATDIRVLFGTFFLEGLAMSFTHPPITAILSEYFRKKRGFANGVAFSGASFGGLVFAPIMTWLLESYGYTGAYLVVAGMMCNILVTASLLRPINSFRKTAPKQPDSKEDTEVLANETIATTKDSRLINGDYISKPGGQHEFRVNVIKSQLSSEYPNDSTVGKDKDSHVTHPVHDAHTYLTPANSHGFLNFERLRNEAESPLLQRTRASSMNARPTKSVAHTSHLAFSSVRNIATIATRSKATLYTSMDDFCGSAMNIQNIQSNSTCDQCPETATTVTCCSKIKSSFVDSIKLIFDISMFKSGVFPVFLVMAFLSAPSQLFMQVCLPPHAKDIGLTGSQAGILVSVISGVGMGSRLGVAVLHDKRIVNINTILTVIALTVGIAAHGLRLFNSFPLLVVFAVILGLCTEIYQAMYAVVLVEHLTLAKLKSCIGFTVLCHGIAQATVFPIVGALKDSTGNYLAAYHLLGTMAMMAAAASLTMSYVHKRVSKKQEINS